jgi:hypothetical protein
MSISSVIEALQTKNAAIDGIVSAPMALPDSLDTIDLPAAVVWPGAGTAERVGAGLVRHEMEYRVNVYVAPVGQGTAAGSYSQAVSLLQAFIDAYLSDPSLSGAIDHSRVTHNGLQVLEYAGQSYRGFTVRLMAVEKWEV